MTGADGIVMTGADGLKRWGLTACPLPLFLKGSHSLEYRDRDDGCRRNCNDRRRRNRMTGADGGNDRRGRHSRVCQRSDRLAKRRSRTRGYAQSASRRQRSECRHRLSFSSSDTDLADLQAIGILGGTRFRALHDQHHGHKRPDLVFPNCRPCGRSMEIERSV